MKYLIRIVFLFIFISCNKNEGKLVDTVVIKKIESNEIDISDYAETSFLVLNTDLDKLIGEVKDICIVKEKVYVLDGMTSSIFLFNLKTGDLIKEINNKGQGSNEYIMPVALSADENNVYVLDMQGMSIVKFDLLLNPISTIKIPQAFFMDFCVVPEGFLLSNQSVLKDSYNIIYINKKGEQIRGFIPYSERYNGLGKYSWGAIGNRFSNQVLSTKKIAFSLAYEDDIYILDEQLKMNKIIKNDYKELSLPKTTKINQVDLFKGDYVYSLDSFLLENDLLVSSFMYRNNRYYNFNNLSSQKNLTGKVVDKSYGIPFFPRWVYKNNLMGVLNLYDFKDFNKDLYKKLNDNGSIDDESYILVFYKF